MRHRRFSKMKLMMAKFRRHRHKVGAMRGLTSIPVRFRGRRR